MTIRRPNNDYIIAAIELLEKTKNGIVQGGTIESKYSSYVASFGGSIIQSGLLATLMIYEANEEKKKIVKILFDLYNKYHEQEKIELENGGFYFKQLIKTKKVDSCELRNRIVEFAVALKLAMRCFEKVENI